MQRHPWIKWYWSDWRSDPCLRMCSLAARGLWAEMLALMHEAVPYGHLLVNGVAPTDAQLAALAGTPPDQIPDMIRELESAGVFSRTRKSVIYSRRMIRDEKKAQTARENGKNGGNPTLGKQTIIPASVNPPDKPPDKPQTPDARDQRERKKGKTAVGGAGLAFEGKVIRLSFEHFDRWKAAYHGIPDIMAALSKLDDFYAGLPEKESGNWFIRSSAALDKQHQAAIARKEAAPKKREGGFVPFGVGG